MAQGSEGRLQVCLLEGQVAATGSRALFPTVSSVVKYFTVISMLMIYVAIITYVAITAIHRTDNVLITQ